jgi:tetratricopeptide (TPR) repeat protein
MRAYVEFGMFDQAIEEIKVVILVKEKSLGLRHASTNKSRVKLIETLAAAQRWSELVLAGQELLELTKADLSLARKQLPGLLAVLALAYRNDGQSELGLATLERSYEEYCAVLGEHDALCLELMSRLGLELKAQGLYSAAVILAEKQISIETKLLGPLHPQTLVSELRLAARHYDSGQDKHGIAILEQLGERLLAGKFQHESSLVVLENVVAGYRRCDDVVNADRWENHLIDYLMRIENTTVLHADKLAAIGLMRLQRSDWETSERVLQRCLALRQQQQPEQWGQYNTMSMLGATLMGQQRYVEAEPLLLAGYEGMVRHQSELPSTADIGLTEALDRLIELYTAMGQPERQQFYRSLRDHATPTAIDEDTKSHAPTESQFKS